jgi:Tfp pilus assembly protein PilP
MRAMLIALSLATTLSAQTPAPVTPAPVPVPEAPAPSAVDSAPTPAPNYAYAPASRRDPFVDLFNRGDTDAARALHPAVRPEGIGGILVDEVVVRGVLQGRAGWIAMVGGPSGRTYTVRAGDRLMDGNVRAIDATSVILVKEVHDPLSVEKQREVRKYLRGEVK